MIPSQAQIQSVQNHQMNNEEETVASLIQLSRNACETKSAIETLPVEGKRNRSTMRLVFLRHAESEFNANPLSTTLDCPLSDRGAAQASPLSGHYSLALVSPLLRARQTLQLSQITCDKIVEWKLVREQRADPCDFMEGEDTSQLETDEQLMDRADLFLEQVQQQFGRQHKEILIVSHCEFIHAVTAESPHNACFVTLDLQLVATAIHSPNPQSKSNPSSRSSRIESDSSNSATSSCEKPASAIIWNDHHLLRYQLFPFMCTNSLLALHSTSRRLRDSIADPSTWTSRSVELFIAPENGAHRLKKMLPRSVVRWAKLILNLQVEGSPEGEIAKLSEGSGSCWSWATWPTAMDMLPLFLSTPNVTGWNTCRSCHAMDFDWQRLFEDAAFQRLEILKFEFRNSIPYEAFNRLPAGLRRLTLREGSTNGNDNAGLKIEYLANIVQASLSNLHTLEVFFEKEQFTVAHWQLLERLPQLTRLGLGCMLPAGRLSFTDIAEQIREAHFGSKLEVLELSGRFAEVGFGASGDDEDTTVDIKAAAAPLLPRLRLLSVVFSIKISLIPVSAIVLGCPKLETICVSSKHRDEVTFVVPIIEEAITFYHQMSYQHSPRLIQGDAENPPVRFVIFARQRPTLSGQTPDALQISPPFRGQIELSTRIPSELEWSSLRY